MSISAYKGGIKYSKTRLFWRSITSPHFVLSTWSRAQNIALAISYLMICFTSVLGTSWWQQLLHVNALFLRTVVSPSLVLPGGSSYSARLYDPLVIPLLYGSDPPLDLSDTTIEIRFTRTRGAVVGSLAPPDAEYRRLSPYRAEVYYPQAPASVGGTFTLQIRVAGSPSVSDIQVTINRKSVKSNRCRD
jgi:hypothetical protein